MVNAENMNKYNVDGDLTAENIAAFLNNYLGGSVKVRAVDSSSLFFWPSEGFFLVYLPPPFFAFF
jgi:hypothetical protein